jgi:hypothetical protein
MSKLIFAASARVQEPIHLLAVTMIGAGLLAVLAIATAITSL